MRTPATHSTGGTARVWATLILGIVLVCSALSIHAQTVAVPQLTRWVTDQTGTLDAQTQAELERRLTALDATKGAQLAVLVVATTGDDTIESYARRVFDAWRIGRANVDDGVLLLVAKDDRRLRIEVGYGLEGAIPDISAGRIIREHIAPRFQQGDYAGGITAGVDRLIGLIEGEPLPPPPAGMDKVEEYDGPLIVLVPLAIMSFLMPVGFAAFAIGVFVLAMFGNIFYALIAAAVAVVFSLIGRAFGAGGRRGMARASRRGGVVGGMGGWGHGGGFGGGGFGGGGFSGGGFGGGGGGGSGGGGASGSW